MLSDNACHALVVAVLRKSAKLGAEEPGVEQAKLDTLIPGFKAFGDFF
jgi:hypothetical protein